METNGLFPSTLGGYRPGKDTWCNAAVFAYDAYEGFQMGMETAAAAIDLQDAYNNVSYTLLMQLLMDMQVETRLVKWIAAALFERTLSMRCGSWASQPQQVLMSLPQGSPLSPVLFNVYTVGVTSTQRVGVGRTMSYADDILVYRMGKDRNEIASALQCELNRIGDWCNEFKANVNPAKASLA
uniref:Reverse transcriptase domain-containing protein n=2 Tax=Arion vulgaris TaxID=1028688 RepID=A0A0B7BRJ4_9EUPU